MSLETLAILSVLLFVICSMASMGLSLKIAEILAPLSELRLVAFALLANFVIAPIVAVAITAILPLNESIGIGLLLLSTAAGAPFLPKLSQVAKGSVAFSVGLMVLLMVTTIVYLPLVLPLLVGEVAVQPWQIAKSLIVLMLSPLAAGLIVNARYEEIASGLQPVMAQAANIGLLLLMVLGVALNFNAMLALVGSYGILAAVVFIVALLVIGYFLGGTDRGIRSVMGLGTAQRNISAALVVAGQNFGLDVITYLMVVSVIGLLVLMPAAGELGRRVGRAKAALG